MHREVDVAAVLAAFRDPLRHVGKPRAAPVGEVPPVAGGEVGLSERMLRPRQRFVSSGPPTSTVPPKKLGSGTKSDAASP
jgi:hypothetical protein